MRNAIPILLLLAIAACDTPEASKEPIVIRNGPVEISYKLSGKGDTTVLFVHGWCIDKNYWQQQQDALSQFYTVVSMDIGGHGQNGHNRTDWSMEEFGKDVTAVVNGLDLKNVVLVGHSMGGDIILEAALAQPDKVIGFVGIDNFKAFVDSFTVDEKRWIDSFMAACRTHFDSTAIKYSRQTLFPPNYADTASVNRVGIESLRKNIDYASSEPGNMAKLGIPVHLIVSDFGETREQQLALYARAGYTIDTIKGVGHYPMIEKPKEFTDKLLKVIRHLKDRK